MKYLLLSMMMACGASCSKEAAKTDSTEQILSSTENEKWDFVTWDECSQWVDSHACNFELMDQNGEMVNLYDYYGKVIIVDLSSMWCPYCVNIAPKAAEFKELYGEDNFIWLTLLVQDFDGNKPDISDLQQWALVGGIDEPILAAGDMVDLSGENGYPVTAYPTIVLITKEMIIYRGVSGWNEDIIKTWIEELL